MLTWQNVLFFPPPAPFLLLSIVLPRQSGTVCLAMSSVNVVFVAGVACSLLWGKDIIGSMPGSHLVVLPSGETANSYYHKAILSAKRYNFIFFFIKWNLPFQLGWLKQWYYAALSYNGDDSGKIVALISSIPPVKSLVLHFYIWGQSTIDTVLIITSLLIVNTNFVMYTWVKKSWGYYLSTNLIVIRIYIYIL